MKKIVSIIIGLSLLCSVGCSNGNKNNMATANKQEENIPIEINKPKDEKVEENNIIKTEKKNDNEVRKQNSSKIVQPKKVTGNKNIKNNITEKARVVKNFEKKLDGPKTYLSGKGMCSKGEYLILKDSCNDLIYVYKNFKLLYTLNELYFNVLASPYDNSFIGDSFDFNNKIYRIYKHNIKTRQKSILYESEEPLLMIGWQKEGIYCYKLDWKSGLEVTPEGTKELYLLKPNKEIKSVCKIQEEELFKAYDILGDWVLFNNYYFDKMFKLNIKTNEKAYIKGFKPKHEIQGLSFFNSPNEIIGGRFTNGGTYYEIFILKNGHEKIVKSIKAEGNLIGHIKNGFVYELNEFNVNKDYSSKGAVYVKILD